MKALKVFARKGYYVPHKHDYERASSQSLWSESPPQKQKKPIDFYASPIKVESAMNWNMMSHEKLNTHWI